MARMSLKKRSPASLLILVIAVLSNMFRASSSTQLPRMHQGLPKETQHQADTTHQGGHDYDALVSQPDGLHLEPSDLQPPPISNGESQVDQGIQIPFPVPNNHPVSSLMQDNNQLKDQTQQLPRSLPGQLAGSINTVLDNGNKISNTKINRVLHGHIDGYKSDPKSSMVGETHNQIQSKPKANEKLRESRVSQQKQQQSSGYDEYSVKSAGSDLAFTSQNDDDLQYWSLDEVKDLPRYDPLSRAINHVGTNLGGISMHGDKWVPSNPLSMQSKTSRKRRKHASKSKTSSPKHHSSYFGTKSLIGFGRYKKHHDDVKMRSVSLHRSSRSTERDYRPVGGYLPSVYLPEPGIFPESWSHGSAWHIGNNPWVHKKAGRRVARPRCDLRHITREMLLEYFMTGKMCGSSVVRIRFGLGR